MSNNSNSKPLTRRELLEAGVAIGSLAALAGILPGDLLAQSGSSTTTAQGPAHFALTPLPYSFSALEPVIDAETMEIHYSKHHQGYVNNLNKELAADTSKGNRSLEQMLESISQYSTAVRNNAGGHYNHELFWKSMAPVGKGGKPSEALLAQIEADFGSFDQMKSQLNRAALSQFGSGWGWLILTEDSSGKKKLAITATPNQDNPLMDLVKERGKPVIGVDVWEHAYYLKYRNNRADYLEKWWQVVNWEEVNRRFT